MKPNIAVACVLGASLVCSQVQADTAPHRQVGLWEISIQDGGVGSQRIVRQCIDRVTDIKLINAEVALNAGMNEPCSKAQLTQVGNNFESLSECRVGDTRVVSKGRLEGNLLKAYSGEIVTSFDPPFLGMKEQKTKIKAKWLGPCTQDFKIGDMVSATGVKLNVIDLEPTQRCAASPSQIAQGPKQPAPLNNPALAQAIRKMQGGISIKRGSALPGPGGAPKSASHLPPQASAGLP